MIILERRQIWKIILNVRAVLSFGLLFTIFYTNAYAEKTYKSPYEDIFKNNWERKKDKNKWAGHLNILGGVRNLSNPDWSNIGISQQNYYGIDYDFAKKTWPVSILIGASQSTGKADYVASTYTVNVELIIEEVDIGVRKYFFKNKRYGAYLTTGAAILKATQKSNCLSGCSGSLGNNETAIGYFLNGGLYLGSKSGFYLGVDYKILTGSKMKNNLDANYGQVSLLLGFGS